ncbi:MAG: guanylate kinase [Lawsonibacter sp.]|nr:guanylate kinase [Lawsonibacter sp.]
MSRIFCLVGKSCSGKDTLYARILERCPELVPVILHTTRPRRPGEVDGQTYHFVTQEQLRRYEELGQVIEKREYHTNQGLWTYFTLRFSLDTDRLMITTLDGARALMDCYDGVQLVYLHVDDRTRLLRYIQRESCQERPDYTEVCRRFVADQADFAQERLDQFPNLYPIDTGAGIEQCLAQWDTLYRQG